MHVMQRKENFNPEGTQKMEKHDQSKMLDEIYMKMKSLNKLSDDEINRTIMKRKYGNYMDVVEMFRITKKPLVMFKDYRDRKIDVMEKAKKNEG
ncbi:hypothetical protein A3Q56_00432 [Intoshia linei]|uniref:Uncharacterized protein n=1 Tax=Intoshia linei TaxID=1819745 RepID=A0A177BDZ1_9BILA|nr:hypothetical protein A3Q56_00432 [Intoshia linei]